VASTDVYGDLVRSVGGDRVSVTSFISNPSQDPHSYVANARDQLAIRTARLVVENGGGYDDFMDTMLKAAPGDREVLNVVALSGHHPTDGGELNEHVWYDFTTVETFVARLAGALAVLDPVDANTFRANAAVLRAAVAALEARVQTLREKVAGQAVAITEPVPLYLLNACGLVNATPSDFSEAIEDGTDVPVTVLHQTLNMFRDHKVRALVYNAQTSGPQTEQVRNAALDNNIPVVPVTESLPSGLSYVAWMSRNLNALEQALS
jgi:zinc/manganese transport system substrate-binding protein